MMRKCVMVKIREAKNANYARKRELSENRKKVINFDEIGRRGEIYKLCGNRGNMQYASLA